MPQPRVARLSRAVLATAPCFHTVPANAAMPPFKFLGLLWAGPGAASSLCEEDWPGVYTVLHPHCRTQCPLCYPAPSDPWSLPTAPIQHQLAALPVAKSGRHQLSKPNTLHSTEEQVGNTTSREGWPQNMPCNPKALQEAARALQPCWCLQGHKPLLSHHPGPCAQLRHIHMNYNQARHSHPCRWLCSAFFSSEPFFPALEINIEPVLLPWQPGNASHSQGTGYSWDPRHRKGTSPMGTPVPGPGQHSASEGRSTGLCRRRRPGMAACKHDSSKRGSP